MSDNTDDGRILSLFREWMVAERATDALPGGDDDSPEQAEAEAASQRTADIVTAIARTPATGPQGLAIKAYIAIHMQDGTTREDAAALSRGALGGDTRLEKSMLEDAVRFVPEIEPLAAKALEEAEKAAAVEPDESNGDAPLESVPGASARHERRTQRNARIAALAAAGSDRALALVQERFRLWEECNNYPDDENEDAFDELVRKTVKTSNALDEQIVDMVATSAAGLIAQVDLLATDEHSLVNGELVDHLVASIREGIVRLVDDDGPAATAELGFGEPAPRPA
jgi:hypothetical protein